MIDLETLATGPDAVILTLGAIKFDPYDFEKDPGPGLYFKFDVNEQFKLGRQANDTTIAWWGEQPEDVREEAMGEEGRIPLNDGLDQLNKFLVGADNIWAQGPVFDICMLENLMRQLNRPSPWQYWQIRDSRTLFGVHGDPRAKGREQAHNALADCYYQARAVQEVFKNLGLKK